MKKNYILATFVAIVFFGCDKEDVSQTEETIAAVNHTYKYKKDKDKNGGCDISLFPDLPETLNACTTAKGVDADNSYFNLTINDSSLAGDYGAWCVDVDLSLNADECFEAKVYSSYESLPEGKFEHPENFDLINWILNQNFIGSASPSGGTYTFGDLQWAIWELIDDQNCALCAYLGSDWSKTKGQEIVDLALANGEGYEPGDGDSLAIVLIPTNNRQSIFIPYELECGDNVGTICKRKNRTWKCIRQGCKHEKNKRKNQHGRKKFKCSSK
jgi:hypothetical protein